MMTSLTHQPVLLSAVVAGLNIYSEGIYVDATFGRGGHSQAILEKLGKNGRLIAIDKDDEAVKAAQTIHDSRFCIFQGSFADIHKFSEEAHISGCINGILFDLGVSSPQLDNPARGFSFRLEGPLDMRMNQQQGMPLSVWLETVNEKNLYDIIKTYGEERFAKKIAKSIIEARNRKPIKLTTELADIIAKAHPAWEHKKHPATRTFQALRIFINHELDELQRALQHCIALLKPGGRLLIISFHSLEDRIVKRFIQQEMPPRKLPLTEAASNKRLRRIGPAIRPSVQEIKQNPRARSAVLRIAEKIK